MIQSASDPPNISRMKQPSIVSTMAMVLRESAVSSGRFVASPSVDIERVVSVQGICGCVSIPLLVLLPCTVFDVGIVVSVMFSVKMQIYL